MTKGKRRKILRTKKVSIGLFDNIITHLDLIIIGREQYMDVNSILGVFTEMTSSKVRGMVRTSLHSEVE